MKHNAHFAALLSAFAVFSCSLFDSDSASDDIWYLMSKQEFHDTRLDNEKARKLTSQLEMFFTTQIVIPEQTAKPQTYTSIKAPFESHLFEREDAQLEQGETPLVINHRSIAFIQDFFLQQPGAASVTEFVDTFMQDSKKDLCADAQLGQSPDNGVQGCVALSSFFDLNAPANETDSVLFENSGNEGLSVAQRSKNQRVTHQLAMMLTFQFSSATQPLITQSDLILADTNEDWRVRYQSLLALRNTYASVFRAPAEFYASDDATKLFAYSMRGEKGARLYAVFNGSYDLHEMPLPLGFMASTKVTVWRSLDGQTDTFVTDRPLTIEPMSAALVFVGG